MLKILGTVAVLMSAVIINAAVRDQSELSVTGGLEYNAWYEQDTSILCCLALRAPIQAPVMQQPLELIFLIDASTGVSGDVMEQMKSAVSIAADRLQDNALFSMISYGSVANTLFPLQPLNRTTRIFLENAVKQINDDQPRNLSDAFTKCDEQFARFKNAQSSGRHVIILTKGNPTAGETDRAVLLAQAAELVKKYSCTISTFGYDRFFDEDFLIALAQAGRGRAGFIEENDYKTIPKKIAAEADRITSTIVSNISLEVVLPQGCTIGNVTGGVFLNDKIYVGNLPQNSVQFVIFSINHRPAKKRDISVYVNYTKTNQLTPATTRCFVDLGLGTGSPVYNIKFAPLLIAFSAQTNLVGAIAAIADADRSKRMEFAYQFRETIAKIDLENSALRSRLLNFVLYNYGSLLEDIQNTAIEPNLLLKRVKYFLAGIVFGVR